MSATTAGNSLTLTWRAPATGEPISEYVVKAGTSSGGHNLFEGSVGPVLSVSRDVANGTYFIRVSARNGGGIGPDSEEVRVVVGAPTPPTPTGCNALNAQFEFDTSVSQEDRAGVRRAIEMAACYTAREGIGTPVVFESFALSSQERLAQASIDLFGWSSADARNYWATHPCGFVTGANANVSRMGIVATTGCATWRQSISLAYTHEYFHLIQYALAHPNHLIGRSTDDQVPHGGPRWLIEGSADLVSFKVLDAYGQLDYQATRLARMAVVRSSSTPLQNLESWTGMEAAEGGTGAAYAIGFAASELLESMVGLDSFRAFWRSIGTGLTWHEAFSRAFGRTINTFYEEFARHRAAQLPAPSRITGVVTQATGAPFPGIHVFACPTVVAECGQAVTDAHGGYAIAVRDGTYLVQFGRSSDGRTPDGFYSAAGFTSDRGRATPVNVRGSTVSGISVVMPASPTPTQSRITGVVTQATGAPFPGIHVFACPTVVAECGQAVTDANGGYAIPVRDGTYLVQFGRSSDGRTPDGFYSAAGFTSDRGRATPVNVRGSTVSGISVVMPASPTPTQSRITGVVTQTTGAPFPGIYVFACPTVVAECGQAITDSSGSYAIAVSDGTFVVQFGRSSDGRTPDGYYSSAGFTSDRGRATPVNVRGTTVSGISVVMPASAAPTQPRITGVVTQTTGAPFPGIYVFACPTVVAECGQAITDSSGSYAIAVSDGTFVVQFGRSSDGRAPDGYYSSAGFTSDRGRATSVNVRGNSVTGISVVMPSSPGPTPTSPRISGVVRRTTGASFSGIHVYACPVVVGECGHAVTDANGSYTVAVSDGTYRVQFGRSSDGRTPDGFYSATGFTSDPARATPINVRGSNVTDINVFMPF